MSVFVAFAIVTAVALNLGGVVVVDTIDAESSAVRSTPIWFVVKDDQILLEAGNPENAWVRDLAGMTTLTLNGENLDGEYRFRFSKEIAREDIRSLMRQKYGWRDWWVDRIF